MGHPPSRREACPESSQEDCSSLLQQRGIRKGAYNFREEDKQRLHTDPNSFDVELGPQRNLKDRSKRLYPCGVVTNHLIV